MVEVVLLEVVVLVVTAVVTSMAMLLLLSTAMVVQEWMEADGKITEKRLTKESENNKVREEKKTAGAIF